MACANRRPQTLLPESYRHEHSNVTALYEQCDLLVVILHHFAQLRHGLHGLAVDRQHDVAGLYAGLGGAALQRPRR